MPVQLMTEAAELSSFLSALADDVARLSFDDWFDERYPATAVRRGELPEGFRAWWFARRLHRLDIWSRRRVGQNWSNVDLLHALHRWQPGELHWFDHGARR